MTWLISCAGAGLLAFCLMDCSGPPVSASTCGKNGADSAAATADDVIAACSRALEGNPNDADAHLRRGAAYYERVAQGGLDWIISQPPGSPAFARLNREDLDRAIADYGKAIGLNRENTEAYRGRGKAYNAKGEKDRAIADYSEAIRLSPENADDYHTRGLTYESKGELDRAIADFNEAIRMSPENARSYSSRGDTYARKGEPDRAIADFERAATLGDDSRLTSVCGGFADMPDDHVIRACSGLIEANSRDSTNRWIRSRVYSRKGEYDLAIADLDRLIAVDLAVNRIDYTCGGTHQSFSYSGGAPNATANDKRSKEVDRSLSCLLVDRGDIYSHKGDYDRAIADYDLALKLHPENDKVRKRAEAARAVRKEPAR